jgi:hypothetical protein
MYGERPGRRRSAEKICAPVSDVVMITTALSLRPFFTGRLTGIFMLNLDSDSHQHKAVRKRKFQPRRESKGASQGAVTGQSVTAIHLVISKLEASPERIRNAPFPDGE